MSYAGGRTALIHIDKALFEPVMIFVDGLGNFIKIQDAFLYQESIRSFYPEQTDARFRVYSESLVTDNLDEHIARIGERIQPQEFARHFDIAFLAMHGPDCEDGAIQGLLEWYKIPYTGPGLMGSAVGINKILQNELIALVNGQIKKTATISRSAWESADKAEFFDALQEKLGLPIVVKAPHQGSSIGVAIVRENDFGRFLAAMNQCFFRQEIQADAWKSLSEEEKIASIQQITDLDTGIGFPVVIEETGKVMSHPAELLNELNQSGQTVNITSVHAEDEVLFEEFIQGQEFSCGVVQDEDGNAVALPPTEIYNVTSFDFKSKYQSNTTRKRIPVDADLEHNRLIQQNVAGVFSRLGMNVCARIDGFLTSARDSEPGRVLLHDPNTIPGMSPSSLIFKQMAEIGLNVTQSITYFIRQSLKERIRTGKDTVRLRQLLTDLDDRMAFRRAHGLPEEVIEVNSADGETAWQEAKARFGKLAADGAVKPAVRLHDGQQEQLLPLNLLFKDTLADVLEAAGKPVHPLIAETRERARTITERYGY